MFFHPSRVNFSNLLQDWQICQRKEESPIFSSALLSSANIYFVLISNIQTTFSKPKMYIFPNCKLFLRFLVVPPTDFQSVCKIVFHTGVLDRWWVVTETTQGRLIGNSIANGSLIEYWLNYLICVLQRMVTWRNMRREQTALHLWPRGDLASKHEPCIEIS